MAGSPGAAFVLTSGVYPGPFDNNSFSTFAIGAALDGSVWVTTQDGLSAYSREKGEFELIASASPITGKPGLTPYIAPVDYLHVYLITVDGSGATGVSYYDQSAASQVTQLPALPNGDSPEAITASADGTLWCVGAQGTPYTFASGTWSAQPAPPGALLSLSAGGASFVLALVTENGAPAIYSWNGSAWLPFAGAASPGANWITACADGSYWSGSVEGLTVTLPDGVTTKAFAFAGLTLGYFASASRYACFFLSVDPDGVSPFTIDMACFGLMEQPPENWPPMTAGQQAAYTAITNACMIFDPAGFRSVYANLANVIANYQFQLQALTCPPGIAPADFSSMRMQLQVELEFAANVRQLFTDIATLNQDLALELTQTYAQVIINVELPPQPQLPLTPVQVILGELLTKLLSAAIAKAPGPAQSVISLGMSIFNHVADAQAQQNGGTDRNSALQIACAKLAGLILSITTDALTTTSAWETSILSDWGQLQACGGAISTGVWYWPPDFDASVVAGSGAAMEVALYQTLMPVRWQILQVWTIYAPGPQPTPSTPAYAPAFSLLYQTDGDGQGDIFFWFYICADQSSSAVINTQGPFPNQNLMLAIQNADLQETDFFLGQNGWALPVQAASGWNAPGSQLIYQPWSSSIDPIDT